MLKLAHGDTSLPTTSKACLPTHKPPFNRLIDSGVSDHMTGNLTYFSTFTFLNSPRKIILADGRPTPALSQGRVPLTNNLFLDDVLLVPTFPTSLLSIQKICSFLNCSVFFTKFMCVFQDVSHRLEIGHGYSRDGLYFLHMTKAASNNVVVASSIPAAMQWHSRLGYPSLFKQKCLVPSLGSLSSLQCDSCQVSKHFRSSFPINNSSRSSRLFDVIHSNYGPLNVSNSSKFKYYALLVNDFSLMTWLFLLHNRAEVFDTFKSL